MKGYSPTEAAPAPAPMQPRVAPTMPPAATPTDGVTTTPYDTTPPDITTIMKSPDGATATIESVPKDVMDKIGDVKTEDELNKLMAEAKQPTAKPAVEGYQKSAEAAPVQITPAQETKDLGQQVKSADTAVKTAYDLAEIARKNGYLTEYQSQIKEAQTLEHNRALAQESHLRSQDRMLDLSGQIANGYLRSVDTDPSQANSDRAWAMAILDLQNRVGMPAGKLMGITNVDQRRKIAQQFYDSSLAAKDQIKAEIDRLRATNKGGAGGAAGSAAGRVSMSMKQATDAVNTLTSLPVYTTGPVYGQKMFGNIFTAPLGALNQAMSEETAQKMQTRMSGVARNLASLETGGAATGLVGLADKIDAGIAIPAGAAPMVVLDKLSEMRRIIESSAEAALSSNAYTPEQKELIRANVEQVRKSIPFTQPELDALSMRLGPKGKLNIPKEEANMSFTEFMTNLRKKADAGKIAESTTKDTPKPSAKQSTMVITDEGLDAALKAKGLL